MTATLSHPAAVRRLNAVTRDTFRRHLAPPPSLTVSEWADRYRRLAPESSAEPGQWRTERAPYLKEVMDAFSDPRIERVTFMASSQSGKTEVLLNVAGYFMHQDPAPILLVEPTIGEAEQFSKTRIAPMIRESPVLLGLVGNPRTRDSGNTLLVKEFPGGHLTIAGANSPSGLAAKPIRIVLLDERDRHPVSAGTEGDPARLAITRTTTFPNRKIGEVSSPTLKGLSEIAKSYHTTDMRVYEVPCPACDHYQRLRWKEGVRWPEGKPEAAFYECRSCQAAIPESKKLTMLRRGRWTPTRERDNPAHIGFHISAIYSPWIGWGEMAVEFVAAKGDATQLQPFINTRLGEEWEERGGGLEPGLIEARKEAYRAEVPIGVGYLLMGTDVQDDRLEYIARGWGAGEESWLIEFGRILGDTSIPFGKAGSPWNDLERIRRRAWIHESGQILRVFAMAVDTQGHSTDAVYAYTGPRYNQRVYAIKGSPTPGAPLVPRKPTRNNKARSPLFVIGSDNAKEVVHSRLRVSEVGPLYMHLPIPPVDEAGNERWSVQEWAVQVTSERKIRKQLPGGKWVSVWRLPIGARNEALDCEAYALAALRLTPLRPAELARMAERLAVPVATDPGHNVEKPLLDSEETPSLPPSEPPPDPPRRRGFVQQWRRPR